MIGRKIIDTKEVTLSEVTEILSTTPEEELSFEQVKTLEYAKKIAKIPKEKVEAAVEELLAAVDKIDRSKAIKIIDLMPESEAEIRGLFTKEIYTLNDEAISKILEIVNKYKSKGGEQIKKQK